jgi:RNA polymerase sigma-70 factor (TIGR02943 family)
MEKNNHKQAHEDLEITKLVDTHSDFLFKYALYRTNNLSVAEDILQETFLAAVKSHKNFKGTSSERTWLISILKRKIVDYYRGLEKEKKLGGVHFDNSENNKAPVKNTSFVNKDSHSPDPSKAYEQKEMMKVLGQCLDQLPLRQHDAFILHEVEEIDTDAICRKLNITQSNLWVMLHRARNRLRTCMKSKWLDNSSKEH